MTGSYMLSPNYVRVRNQGYFYIPRRCVESRYPSAIGIHRWLKERQKPLGPIDYSKGAPRTYRCNKCRAYGVKLLRRFADFTDANDTVCVDCAEIEQHAEQGRDYRYSPDLSYVGCRVPAVPTPDGSDFWFYSYMDAAGIAWWLRLPDRPSTKGKTNDEGHIARTP